MAGRMDELDRPSPQMVERSCLLSDWQNVMREAIERGIAQGMAFVAATSGGRASLVPTVNLENSTAETASISKGDFDMSKRLKERVQIGTDGNGRPIYKWADGATRQELQFNIARLLMESGCIQMNDDQMFGKAQSAIPTVREFILNTYKPTFIDHLRPKTIENYQQYIELNIIPFMGEMRLDEVNVSTIQQFYDWMAHAAERGRKKNLNRKTIERVSGLTSRVFKVACEMNLIHESPFKKTLIKIKAEPAGHHVALPDAQVAHIKNGIPELEGRDERIYMALLVFTGMRPEEIYGLRWQDVYLDQQYGIISLAVTYPGNNKPHIDEPKTERSKRTVVFSKTVIEILRPYQQESGFICGGKKPWCYSTARRVSKRAFQSLGITGYINYDFRTTFGTQLKESGHSSAIVADLMGHADTRMVETVYARTRHEGVMKQLNAIEKLNNCLS